MLLTGLVLEKHIKNSAAFIYPSSVLITTGLFNLWTWAQLLMLLISLKTALRPKFFT